MSVDQSLAKCVTTPKGLSRKDLSAGGKIASAVRADPAAVPPRSKAASRVKYPSPWIRGAMTARLLEICVLPDATSLPKKSRMLHRTVSASARKVKEIGAPAVTMFPNAADVSSAPEAMAGQPINQARHAMVARFIIAFG
ncbi:MAG TPA: hypothetical protein VJS47_01225 [Rhizomicrobium sp.]|nr:hypothetical protein [Rhizomicrobium sp.]